MNDDSSSHSASSATHPSLMARLRDLMTDNIADTEELIRVLRKAQRKKVLDNDALSIIEGALQVSDMQVRDIMVPRSQVVTVKASDSPQDILPVVIEAQHSRFPVIGDSLDEVLGILLAKDLLKLALNDHDERKFDIKDVMRSATFVPESKRLNVLLKEFRENRNHMAIVIDEYGDLAGLCTIEDVLEQIVGEIEDEHDTEDEAFIKQLDESSFTVKALTTVEDFNQHFNTDFPTDEFDTIGGVVLSKFGRIPQRDDSIVIDRFTFKILNADNRQIRLLHVSLSHADEATEHEY
ncbi:MAG TPA: transporter associated domain-containing protein [Candidatus Acidoferrum sp.]|nr:transporter associated domain-containing protein [Candidatus Acidoferrum sp.]